MDTQDTSDITSIGTTLDDSGTPHTTETPSEGSETPKVAPTPDPAAKAATPATPDPDATPKPEATADATDDEDVQPGDTPQKTAARTRGRLQKRIDSVTERAYKAEGRAELLEQRLAALEQQATARTTEPQPGTPPQTPAVESFRFGKSPEEFNSYEEFLDARDDARDAWRQQRAEHAAAVARATADADRAAATERELATTAAERLTTFKATNPDYDQVVPQLRISVARPVMNELHASDYGAHIVYSLAKDPTAAAAFAAMSPTQQLREIGRREAAFAAADAAATAAKQAPPRPKPTTAAPEPLEHEGGPSAGVVSDEDLDTDARIDRWQAKERAERQRRLGIPTRANA